MVSLRV